MIPSLQANDKVALVCPGSICVEPSWPVITRDFLQQRYQLSVYFSDETSRWLPPKQRARIFLDYLFDTEIKGIAALRGGEGTADIIPYLHQERIHLAAIKPKWLLGFSDFTALLVYFAQHYRWPVMHGGSVLNFALHRVDEETEYLTMDTLHGKRPFESNALTELIPLNKPAQQTGISITAELTGGCLSLLDISIKDIWEIDTNDKIIFIEDVNEKAHKIHRTLKYFTRIGLFTRAKAIILGDFTCQPIGTSRVEQEENRLAILKILSCFAENHSIPVLYTQQFGHGKRNFPLWYCRPYRLELEYQPRLILL
jgi:muramoyltetrapeptide carboxypeptidase